LVSSSLVSGVRSTVLSTSSCLPPQTNGGPILAAFPMRTGCAAFGGLDASTATPAQLLVALGQMAAVFNNATGDLPCFDLPTDDEDDGMWDYMWCTETLPQETYFKMDGNLLA
jgi:lysosomal Pro-X carboxypeptidase